MTGVLRAYEGLVARGELRPDARQAEVARHLDGFARALEAPPPRLLFRLLGRPRPGPRGVYLWGGVGRGKSMLM
ncbi:AFG1/ZapE family ATPase, partial [Thermaurantiacus sp.]